MLGRLNKGYKVLVKEGKEKEERIQELLDYYEDKVTEDYIEMLREATEIQMILKSK